jgi:hypothetical protein
MRPAMSPKIPSIRRAAQKARERHDDIAADRAHGDGRLGDEELVAILVVPYPTLTAQLN